jgi:hypothetical protein
VDSVNQISLLDAGLVTLVLIGTDLIKRWLPWLPTRLVPLVPIILGWLLAVPAIIFTRGEAPPFLILVSGVFLEGLKVAAVAMATYKIGHTTIKGG